MKPKAFTYLELLLSLSLISLMAFSSFYVILKFKHYKANPNDQFLQIERIMYRFATDIENNCRVNAQPIQFLKIAQDWTLKLSTVQFNEHGYWQSCDVEYEWNREIHMLKRTVKFTNQLTSISSMQQNVWQGLFENLIIETNVHGAWVQQWLRESEHIRLTFAHNGIQNQRYITIWRELSNSEINKIYMELHAL